MKTTTVRITRVTRGLLNAEIAEIVGTRPLPSIPMDRMLEAFRDLGLRVVQEDGTEWSGFLCGADGMARFDLADESGHEVSNAMLILTWHKFESGRYEVVAYVS